MAINSSIDLDFIGFSYGGVHSETLKICRVSDGSFYNEVANRVLVDKTTELNGQDGSMLLSSYHKNKTFTINIAFDSLLKEDIERIKEVFDGKTVKPLVFDEFPYKVYDAKVTGAPELKYICFEEIVDGVKTDVYKGEGTINFVCYVPYAHSEEWVTLTQDDTDFILNQITLIPKQEIKGTYYQLILPFSQEDFLTKEIKVQLNFETEEEFTTDQGFTNEETVIYYILEKETKLLGITINSNISILDCLLKSSSTFTIDTISFPINEVFSFKQNNPSQLPFPLIISMNGKIPKDSLVKIGETFELKFLEEIDCIDDLSSVIWQTATGLVTYDNRPVNCIGKLQGMLIPDTTNLTVSSEGIEQFNFNIKYQPRYY